MKFYKSLGLLACLVAITDCARRQEDHSMHSRQFSSVDSATVPWRELPLPGKETYTLRRCWRTLRLELVWTCYGTQPASLPRGTRTRMPTGCIYCKAISSPITAHLVQECSCGSPRARQSIMARRRTKMPSFCSSGTSHLTFSSRIRRQQPSQPQIVTDINTSSRR